MAPGLEALLPALLAARRQLLSEIARPTTTNSRHDYLELTKRPASVDLLPIEDPAVARTNEWMNEQLYTIVNDRYQDERSVLFTVTSRRPHDLAQHVGERTYSRLVEMCGDPLPLRGEDHRIYVGIGWAGGGRVSLTRRSLVGAVADRRPDSLGAHGLVLT